MNATPQRRNDNRRRHRLCPGMGRLRAGFTLVELLTVIAIIAILTAIILPVFSVVKENARRTACMSNMQQMYAALRQYELDNRRYPDFLLSPAIKANGTACATVQIPNTATGTTYGVPAAAGDAVCTIGQANSQQLIGGQYADPNTSNALWSYAGGLYPEYIKSLEVFHCPNDTPDFGGADVQTDTTTATAARAAVGSAAANGTNTTPSQVDVTYYKYDSYDANPSVAGGNYNRNTYETRYSRLWTRVRAGTSGDPLPTVANDGTVAYNSYRNQLYWRAPSGDTYITMCTYHAPKGKATVLWLSGSAHIVDMAKLQNNANLAPTVSGRDYDMYKLGPAD